MKAKPNEDNRGNSMKEARTERRLSISNLAWMPEAAQSVLPKLSPLGVTGVEVALTRIATWDTLTIEHTQAYRAMLADHDLVPSSLQAIFFNQPNAQLLGSQQEFITFMDHLKRILDWGESLGASRAVLGAPHVRRRGSLSIERATNLAAERLQTAAKIFSQSELQMVIEPVPEQYGGDFLTTSTEVQELVLLVNDRSIATHLDVGCMLLAQESIELAIQNCAPTLKHFHASTPGLGSLEKNLLPQRQAASALSAIDYKGWVTIEILAGNVAAEELDRSLQLAAQIYLPAAGSA